MDILGSFLIMKNVCVYSLELPHQGNSKEYVEHTIL